MVDWVGDAGKAGGVRVVVAAACLMGLIVMKDCCLIFQRLPVSPVEVPLLGRQ